MSWERGNCLQIILGTKRPTIEHGTNIRNAKYGLANLQLNKLNTRLKVQSLSAMRVWDYTIEDS